jgi:hypothetical protein
MMTALTGLTCVFRFDFFKSESQPFPPYSESSPSVGRKPMNESFYQLLSLILLGFEYPSGLHANDSNKKKVYEEDIIITLPEIARTQKYFLST